MLWYAYRMDFMVSGAEGYHIAKGSGVKPTGPHGSFAFDDFSKRFDVRVKKRSRGVAALVLVIK